MVSVFGWLWAWLGVGRRRLAGLARPAEAGTAYRSVSYSPLRPWQVRSRRFTPVGFRHRGVDAGEVGVFLDRVADDLEQLYRDLAGTREQNHRIKDALRRWQSQQAVSPLDLAGRR